LNPFICSLPERQPAGVRHSAREQGGADRRVGGRHAKALAGRRRPRLLSSFQ